jgi:hypothetical protein
MFFTMKEMNPKGSPLTPEQEKNLKILIDKMDKVRAAWGKPMIVTSGFRSLDDHKRIYRQLAAKRGLDVVRVPMGSAHLKGLACDISDPDGSLMAWCQCHVSLLADIALWMEAPDDQKRVHFQSCAPASFKRFFKP